MTSVSDRSSTQESIASRIPLHLGLLGLGRLGRHMVPIGRAFGMEVIAWSQNMTPELAA